MDTNKEKYKCEKCKQAFKREYGLIYHLKKNVCATKICVCKLCNKKFSSATSMYRHARTVCKVKIQQEHEKELIYNELLQLRKDKERVVELEKQVEELKKEVKKKSKFVTNNVSNTINSQIIDRQYNIVLVGCGKEDLSKIDKNELIKAFRMGYHSTLNLTETIHFNPKYPEYHNVYIPSMKEKYAMMYDGQNWELVLKNDVIDKIYDSKKDYIETNMEKFYDSLNESQINALNRWLDTDRADENDPKILKIKEQIKLLLFNKRNMITKNLA